MNEILKKQIEQLPAETMTELHAHTDAYANIGIGDGAQTIFELADIAIEKGAVACAITDHGNCVNWIDFYNYCNGDEVDHKSLPNGSIKPILGVEAYIKTDGYYAIETNNEEVKSLFKEIFKENEIMQHLIILAKNYQGMKQISRFVSETNRHVDEKGRAIGTVELLKQCFGTDAEDTGNVICMSACVGGVLATPLAFNHKIQHEVEKIERRIEKSKELLPAEYFAAKEHIAEATKAIDALTAEMEPFAQKAAKNFKEAKERIKAEKDIVLKDYLKKQLKIGQEDKKEAKKKLDEYKVKIQNIKTSVSDDRKIVTKHKNKAATIDANLDKVAVLNAAKKSEAELFTDATDVLKQYTDIFGLDFYAEVQYHGDKLEAEIYPLIAKLARENGVKLVATNDNHMAKPEDLQKRMLLRNCTRIKTGQWSGPMESDSELYFKTNIEKAEMLSQILPDDMVLEAISNIAEITNACNLRLPETKANKKKGITEEMVKQNLHYPEFKDADQKLHELAVTGRVDVELLDGSKMLHIACPNAGTDARYGADWDKEKQGKMEYELSVIAQMKVSSYFLFIADVIGVCKAARDNALDIGPGRGSGVGSIVCYLTGITDLDPLSQGLLFERFLNPERVSMPKQYWAFSVNPITQGCNVIML